MTRNRNEWARHMRIGTAVTVDPEPKPMTISNRIILRLLRGPALDSELGVEGYVPDHIGVCNFLLRESGRHIDSEKVEMLSPLGLTMKCRRYTLVRTCTHEHTPA